MPYDIYGQNLRAGHCEVHPHIHEEYPCSQCMIEKEREEQRQAACYQQEREDYERQQELDHLRAENERLSAERSALQAIVNEQAENEGLWFIAKYATEAYLQSELRRLHEAIEGKTGDEIAREIVSGKQVPESDKDSNDA